MPKLAQARAKLSQRWLRLERFDIIKDIKARDLKENQVARTGRATASSQGARSSPRTPPRNSPRHGHHSDHHDIVIPMEDRIQLQLIPEGVRMTFITHELRTRRHQLLPQITLWENDVASWNKELSEWEETRKAYQVMGIVGVEHGALRWPPQRPTYMPAEFGEDRTKGNAEVLDMIRKARAHPNGGGWNVVPQKVIGRTVTELGALQAKGKQGSFEPGGDEDNPFGQVSHQELRAFQVSEDALPTEFREAAPGMNAPQWRQIP